MDRYSAAPRFVAEPIRDPIESAIAAVGHRSRGAVAALMPVLVRYWHELPRHAPFERRRWLEATRARVRAGEATARAFVPHALGDHDEDVVFAATAEYVGAHPVSIERRKAVIDEATEWIRRGLALNRGAVFAALLAVGDAAIDEALGGLRLILTPEEIEVVCRRAAVERARATRVFLAEWLELLDAAEQPDVAARALVADALLRAAPASP
jgi:hypothetical protein